MMNTSWRTRAHERLLRGAAAIALAAALAPAALAQEDSAAVQSAGSVTEFEPDFFSQYNPTTAFDMVQRVPGFSIDFGDNRRGFNGTGANVLINGERPSTKSGIGTTLGRIPAASVARVDLIVGSAPGIEMRGQSRVVNVVLNAETGSAQTQWAVQVRHHGDGRLVPTGEISTSRTSGRLTYNAGVEVFGGGWRTDVSRTRFDENNEFVSFTNQPEQDYYREVFPSGDLEFKLNDRNTLRANGGFWIFSENEKQQSDTFTPDFPGPAPRDITFGLFQGDGWGARAGADWERQLTPEWSTKLLGFHEYRFFESDFAFDEFDSTPAFVSAFNQTFERIQSESILSATATRTSESGSIFEFGVEAAYNLRDQTLELTLEEAGSSTPVFLPVADTKVEELRGEAFASRTTPLSPTLTLETGLRWEVSEIKQTGGGGLTRTLDFPKPSANLTWLRTPKDQFRIILERDVEQLDFGDFATSNSILDDQVDAGNVELEPERSWNLSVSRERRFGEKGSITITAYHDWVEEVSDVAPITIGGDTFDAPANIGDGRRWGASAEFVTPLDAIGITGGILEIELEFDDSTVVDPVTGADRRFSFQDEWFFYTEFRQDLPARGFSWGWDYAQGGPETGFRRNETQEFTWGFGDLDVFIETTRVKGFVIRAGMDNIFRAEFDRERTFFSPDRNGAFSGREVRVRKGEPTAFVRVSGTF